MSNTPLKHLLIVGLVLATAACGHTPSRLGVRLDEVGVTKTRIGPAPADLDSRRYLPGSSTRLKRADLLGDRNAEQLVEMPNGGGVEIRDQSGAVINTVRTSDYLTDFGSVPAGSTPGAGTSKQLLVLYTYPNKQKGGTFQVLNAALEQIATWDELPPAGSFSTGEWRRQPALFYLQGDTVVIRSPAGTRLQELRAPEGSIFRDVFVQTLPRDRTVVLASGSGYTQYHMVCVYDGTRLVFQEVSNDLAYGVESADDESGFVVTARDGRWKYTLK